MGARRDTPILAILILCNLTIAAKAIDIATAKSMFINTGEVVTLDNVRISNLFDMVDTPNFTLINVEDDTGGIAIFLDSLPDVYTTALPGDVFDISAELGTFFGLEEILDGSLGRPPATVVSKGMNVQPKVTPVPITAFPGVGQQDGSMTPDDPFFEALESTQIVFENVTIDHLRQHERDGNGMLIDPPIITVPDGNSVVFPHVTADDDFATFRISDGLTPEADRPIVRIRSSSAPVIGQVIPRAPLNIRALVYDVAREDGIGEGRYRPYVLDVESTLHGDVDYDDDVDADDYAVAMSSFTQPAGLMGSTAPVGVQIAQQPIVANSWDDGNLDRDFDVDNSDLLALVAAITSPPPTGEAGVYTLMYDADTGEVSIDTAGGVLTGYSLKGSSLDSNAHTPLLTGTSTSDASELSEADLFSDLTGTTLSLGTVLAPGLSLANFRNQFSSAIYTAEPGTGLQPFAYALASDSPGDFNGDGLYDCTDIDQLVAELSTGGNDLGFDVNGDNVIDQQDLRDWLAVAGEVNLGPGRSYLVGDGNCDGTVDVSDFNLWNSHKFTATGYWSKGDYNADGSSDVSDFNLWNTNKFTSSDSPMSVPEPSGLVLFGFAFLFRRWTRFRAE